MAIFEDDLQQLLSAEERSFPRFSADVSTLALPPTAPTPRQAPTLGPSPNILGGFNMDSPLGQIFAALQRAGAMMQGRPDPLAQSEATAMQRKMLEMQMMPKVVEIMRHAADPASSYEQRRFDLGVVQKAYGAVGKMIPDAMIEQLAREPDTIRMMLDPLLREVPELNTAEFAGAFRDHPTQAMAVAKELYERRKEAKKMQKIQDTVARAEAKEISVTTAAGIIASMGGDPAKAMGPLFRGEEALAVLPAKEAEAQIQGRKEIAVRELTLPMEEAKAKRLATFQAGLEEGKPQRIEKYDAFIQQASQGRYRLYSQADPAAQAEARRMYDEAHAQTALKELAATKDLKEEIAAAQGRQAAMAHPLEGEAARRFEIYSAAGRTNAKIREFPLEERQQFVGAAAFRQYFNQTQRLIQDVFGKHPKSLPGIPPDKVARFSEYMALVNEATREATADYGSQFTEPEQKIVFGYVLHRGITTSAEFEALLEASRDRIATRLRNISTLAATPRTEMPAYTERMLASEYGLKPETPAQLLERMKKQYLRE